jgi:hypothetical protein
MKKIILFCVLTLVVFGFLLAQNPQSESSKKTLVYGMIYGSKFLYPEASKIMEHYCFGDGSDLVLDPSFIKDSPDLKKVVNKMKVGEKKRVWIKQRPDNVRLTYAMNGFWVQKTKDSVIVSQYTEFDKTDKTYTYLFLGGKKIKMNDNIVHVFNCKPFMVRCSFKRDS